MLLSEHKKGNMFKAKTLIEKVGTNYLACFRVYLDNG